LKLIATNLNICLSSDT